MCVCVCVYMQYQQIVFEFTHFKLSNIYHVRHADDTIVHSLVEIIYKHSLFNQTKSNLDAATYLYIMYYTDFVRLI